MLPVYFLVAHFADDGKAMAASISAGMLAVVVKYFWDLRKRIWFWTAIAFLVFLHVLLVLFLPPPAKHWNYVHWNYVQMLPFGFLDFAVAYALISLFEKISEKG